MRNQTELDEELTMKTSNDRQLSWVVSRRCRWCCSPSGRVRADRERRRPRVPAQRTQTLLNYLPSRRNRCRTSRCSRFNHNSDSYSASDRRGGLQQLSTTPVITQVSGPVSRMVVVPGQKVVGRAHAVRVQSGLFPAAHQLSEGQGCVLRWRKKHTSAPRTCTSITPSQ